MRTRYAIFSFLVVFLVLAMSVTSKAVNTREIERIRNKAVLDRVDFQVIDNFVAEGVAELVATEDFTSIARIRTVILSYSSSATQSAQAQYSVQFFESAYKYISQAFRQAAELTPQDRKFKIVLNLLILLDGLGNPQLAELALEMLDDQSPVIRYWAVRSVTNPAVIDKLNSTNAATLKLAGRIVEQLGQVVEGSGPEILAKVSRFAAVVQISQADQLLLQIADMRISQYADWTVEDVLLDATVLKSLSNRIAGGINKPAVAQRFGQLFSYTIQRYIHGYDYLSIADKRELASVLVETEKFSIGKLMGKAQESITGAVEQGDYAILMLEHNKLLGNKATAGELAVKLSFDYGRTEDGSKRTAPVTLPKPPEPKREN